MKKIRNLSERRLYGILSKQSIRVISLTLFFSLLTVIQLYATENFAAPKKITGSVTTEKGEPIPGVSIIVKGTTTGTITDISGNYSFDAPETATTLVFTYVGMITEEVLIGNQSVINVVLKEAAVGLDEVVVIGYGEVQRKDLTGSVGSVNMEELQKAPVASAIEGPTYLIYSFHNSISMTGH